MDTQEDLFTQVRVAHRLLEGYYKRVFQLVEEVADEFELQFLAWSPTEYERPCQKRSKVTDRWAWDLLPGAVTQYLYISSGEKGSQQVGDWFLCMKIISDDALTNIDENQEVAVSPEHSKSLLRCDLVMTHMPLTFDWYDEIWDCIPHPELTGEPVKQCMDAEHEIYANAFQMPLEELTKENGMKELIKKISDYRDVLAAVDG